MTTLSTEILLFGHASSTNFDDRKGRDTLFVVFSLTRINDYCIDVFNDVTNPYVIPNRCV